MPQLFFSNKYVGVIYVVLSVVLLSCNSANDKSSENNEPVADSLQTAHSIAAEDSTSMFENKADEWITRSLKINNINWSGFRLTEFWYDDSLKQNDYNADSIFYKAYAPLLKWSPDSSYILDMGTIGAALIKDKTGNTHIEDGDIDTEISFLYPGTKKKARILYFGSHTELIDARWINASDVAILGSMEGAGPQQDTLLWIVNAKTNYFRKYKWQ